MATTPVEKQGNPVRRPRGRPRDPRVEGAVLGATRELLLERGYGGLTIAAVADAAGVGKGTIYLRWPDKESLVVGALAELWEPIADPDTGSLRDDLVAVMGRAMREMNGRPGAMLREVLAEVPRCPALEAYWRNDIVGPWVDLVEACFARAVSRREMRSDVDTQSARQVLLSPLFAVGVVGGKKMTTRQVTSWVDLLLDGISA